jgi:O-methyltransferase
MTGVARLAAAVDAVRHCERRGISGAIVECGVWRGGSMLAMLLTLAETGAVDRDVFLYDTFEGMNEPSSADVSRFDDRSALDRWREHSGRPWPEVFGPEAFSEEGVRETVARSGYPVERMTFVRGEVEHTIPATVPRVIAVLRLDTDWYESTRHELNHLYPLLVPGGILIVDDYGHWDGARRAVDEYFASDPDAPLLARIDYTGRIAVKPKGGS